MAIELREIETAARAFSEKYGVKFSIASYNTKAETLRDVFGKDALKNDANYKSEFMKIFKQAFGNYVEGKTDEFKFEDMLKDFENDIMKPYREYCKEKKIPAPKAYGGWNSLSYHKDVRNYMQGISHGRSTYTEQRYVKGEIRIRDMRAYAEQLSTKEVPTAEEIATLQIYANALDGANSGRGFWWKVFHPVRNNAEQREAKSFQAQVDKLTGKADMEGYIVNGGAKNNELVTLYSEAVDDVLQDKIIDKMYEAVKNAIKEKSAAKPTAPATKEEKKEKVDPEFEAFRKLQEEIFNKEQERKKMLENGMKDVEEDNFLDIDDDETAIETGKEKMTINEANLTVDAPKSEFHKDEKINEKTMVKGE
jgi:hypothetical protein